MGALGLTAAPFPTEIGGAGFSYLGWTLVMEELGAADMAMAVSLSVHILSQYPVVTWGTDEQRARWLPAMQSGEALGAFALTEPHAGSDAAAIRTRAERVGAADAPSRVPADRHQDLDLERARGRPVSRVRDRGSRGGSGGDHRVPRREGHGRVPVRGARAEDGDPGLSGGGARLRGVRGAGREPAGSRGRGVPDRAVGPGGGADLDRGRVRGPGTGRSGGRGRVPRGAAGVRQAAFRPAGPAVHAGRDGAGRGGGAGTHPGSRRGQGSRRAPGGGLVTGQMDRLGRGDAGRHGCGPAVRRERATRAKRAWNA